jgi:hypothetical protein
MKMTDLETHAKKSVICIIVNFSLFPLTETDFDL